MHASLLTQRTRLHQDQSLVLVGCGVFGRSVVQLIKGELDRLGVPDDRVACLAFDPTASTNGPGADTVVPMPPFQAETYLAQSDNESLREAVAHLPEPARRDLIAHCERLPSAALVAFHRWDETVVTQRMRATLDAVRAANPNGRVRCVVVCALGSGMASGMAVPFLYRVRDHLRMRNASLEVVLVTTEPGEVDGAEPDASVAPTAAEVARNATANAMLWEHVLRADGEILYPGREGVREDKNLKGPLVERTWIFSAGAGDSAQPEPVVASIVASCIATLVRTPLGAQLEAERADYAESVLERGYKDGRGVRHPTQLLAMNVGGLKLDCFPAIFHLRAARAFLEEVTRTMPPAGEQGVRDSVETCLRDARLYDDAIVEDLGVGAKPVTREEIAAAKLPQSELHGWLSARLDDDVGRLVAMANGRHDPGPTEVLLDRARLAVSTRATAIANSAEGWLPGAILFYRVLQKNLETARASVLHRADLARDELGTTPNRDRLNVLLERLHRDTVPADGNRFGIIERFVATITVSVPTQVRKILEVATEIRNHAQVVAAGTVLATVYDNLAQYCEKQRQDLQVRLYQLNNAAAQCMRDEELVQRSARAAFTYQRARFEPLLEHLCGVLRQHVHLPTAADVIARVGGDLPQFVAHESRLLNGLLAAVQIDAGALAAAADEILAGDAAVRDALKESLAQFFPTVQVERERLIGMQTVRARFVLCTRRMYEAHCDDVFEGYRHVETTDPYDVLCTDHEEGLPFAVLAPMRRAHERYRVLIDEGRANLGHPSVQLATTLVSIDA